MQINITYDGRTRFARVRIIAITDKILSVEKPTTLVRSPDPTFLTFFFHIICVYVLKNNNIKYAYDHKIS